MKKFKNILVVIFISIFAIIAPTVSAVTKQSGTIKLTVDEPLFASTVSWYPGLVVSKTITVNNTSGDNKELSFQAINTDQTGSMAGVLFFNVKEGVSDLYGAGSSKTLQNFWDAGEVKMLDISGGSIKNLTINITMNQKAGNEYQGKEAFFDLNIGFVGEKPVTVSSSSSNSCGNSKPSAPGALTGAVGPEDGQITLSWGKPTGNYTYFLLAYGDTKESPKWGNPDIGKDVVYTVSGLGTGTYYFWVRAGNGCMPGDFVGPTAVTISSGALGALPNQPASGFVPGVLGETTENDAPDLSMKDTENKGEVRGSEIKDALNKFTDEGLSFNWSFPLAIGGLLLLGIILGYLFQFSMFLFHGKRE